MADISLGGILSAVLLIGVLLIIGWIVSSGAEKAQAAAEKQQAKSAEQTAKSAGKAAKPGAKSAPPPK